MMFEDKSLEQICSMQLGAYRQKTLFLRKVMCTLNIQATSIKNIAYVFFYWKEVGLKN